MVSFAWFQLVFLGLSCGFFGVVSLVWFPWYGFFLVVSFGVRVAFCLLFLWCGFFSVVVCWVWFLWCGVFGVVSLVWFHLVLVAFCCVFCFGLVSIGLS